MGRIQSPPRKAPLLTVFRFLSIPTLCTCVALGCAGQAGDGALGNGAAGSGSGGGGSQNRLGGGKPLGGMPGGTGAEGQRPIGGAGAGGIPGGSAGGASGVSPGAGTDGGAALSTAPPSSPIVINELMYHPVDENAADDNHEFVELANRGKTPISLAGWSLSGEVMFTFPAGTQIQPGKFIVVAKNRKAVLEVTKYAVDGTLVLGDYTGQLDNGSGVIRLGDANRQVVDAVAYKSKFPWPMGPDALGAGDDWVAAKFGKSETHRYMGMSLERVSVDLASGEIANWGPSALDGATPGRPNSIASAVLLPTVSGVSVAPVGKPEMPAAPADKVQITVTFSGGTVRSADIEYWIEDPNAAKKTPTPLALMANVAGGWEAQIPAQPANSVVRYRVFADRGKARELVGPRPSDPMDSFAYWVSSPNVPAGAYQILISRKDWSNMYEHVQAGMVPEMIKGMYGCVPNATWDTRVAATFIAGGQVFDTRVRYAGSRWNRTNGAPITSPAWPGAEAPALPKAPLVALSWNVKLPRYQSFEGRRTVYLNKLLQSCPGLQPAVGTRLFATAGIPSPNINRFMRVYVNGRYYHYMMDIEHADEDMLKRYFTKTPSQAKGELIKANSGAYGDEGPWGIADFRPLVESCNFTKAQRYAATWERQTHTWKGHDELVGMFEELATARMQGNAAIRAFFAKYFDVEEVTTYLAIRNWSAAWDDTYHNFQLYKLPDTGKWILSPLDMDWEFGAAQFTPMSSLYLGTMMFTNQWKQWGTYKDAFLTAFKSEFEKKLIGLSQPGGILSPEKVASFVDEEAMRYNLMEHKASPAGVPPPLSAALSCDIAVRIPQMKQFARDRHAQVMKLKP